MLSRVGKVLAAVAVASTSLVGPSAEPAHAGVTEFTSTIDVGIPDNGYSGLLSSMAGSALTVSGIPAGHTVVDLTVVVAIDHQRLGDLTVKLVDPARNSQGEEALPFILLRQPVGDAASDPCCDDGRDQTGDTTNLSASYPLRFSDLHSPDAERMGYGLGDTDSVCKDGGPCNFHPNDFYETMQSKFKGSSPNGVWKLYIGDSMPGEAGVLGSWTLILKTMRTLTSCDGNAPPFTDVPATHPFCREIQWVKDEGVASGFGDGTYKPSTAVTRQAMSAFMARLAGAMLPACSSPPFSDVPTNHPFCKEIKWMKDEGISTGFQDGTYQPGAAVTRQAMSAFLARLADTSPQACSSPPFADVGATHPFCTEINWMRLYDVSTGFSDGTYKPSQVVTRQAMAAFLYRTGVLGVADPPVTVRVHEFSAAPDEAIPDDLYDGTLFSMLSSAISVSGVPADHAVTDVSVKFGIFHTFVGDITVKLLSPDGTLFTLINRPGSNVPDNGADSPRGSPAWLYHEYLITIDDRYSTDAEYMGGADDWWVCLNDGGCHFNPSPDTAIGPTSFQDAFRSQSANGWWSLWIGDSAHDGLGELVTWTLTLRTALPL
jgi:subtilisin-like proprotein convertase family protein